MVTARIAYDRLSPSARREADRLIAVLARETTDLKGFVAASQWMDTLKAHGFRLFDPWHYRDRLWSPDGRRVANDRRREDVVWAICQAASACASTEATPFERAIALRLLLHLVGDIHQPLHGLSRVTAELPGGDRGGNLFPLAGPYPDLHSLWDATAGLLPRVSATGTGAARRIPAMARRVVALAAAPLASETAEKRPQRWADESFELGKLAYVGVVAEAQPSPAYLERVREVSARRLVLGGIRLADLLEEVFSGHFDPAVRCGRDP